MERCISSYPVQGLGRNICIIYFIPSFTELEQKILNFVWRHKRHNTESGIIFPTVQARKLRVRGADKFLHAYMLGCFGHVQLCNPMNCTLPASSVHGVSKARLLEWVAMLSSGRSSWPRDQTYISWVSCIGRQVLYQWCHPGSPNN